MGFWGVKLYQNDVACDVKLEYINNLKAGFDNRSITNSMIDEYINSEDEIIFWFALADTQWEYGRLLEEVKKEAIKYIDSEIDLERWKEESKLLEKRKQVLLELKEKLKSPQPQEKKVSKLTSRKSPFKVGDLLLYQIKNENHKWYKKYVLFQVIGLDVEYYSGLPKEEFYDESPVVGLYNFIGEKEKILKNIKQLKFINSNLTEADNRFAVLCFNNRDFKKANFQVLYNDEKRISNCKNSKDIGMNIATLNIYNFESYLITNLESNQK